MKLNAIASWSFGYPYQVTHRIPGEVALIVGIAGVALLAAGAGWAIARPLSRRGPGLEAGRLEALALAVGLALATPVAEAAILLAGGTDLFGARNLNLASGGFAVLLSGLAVIAGPLVAAIGVGGLLAVFSIGTSKSLDSSYAIADFHAASAFIDRHAGANDVVVDMESTRLSPVPTTSLQAQMSGGQPVYNLYQPSGPPPFLTAPPPSAPILKRAVREAQGGTLYLVAGDGAVTRTRDGIAIHLPGSTVFRSFSNPNAREPATEDKLPGWRLVGSRRWPGLLNVNVYVLSAPPSG